MTKVDEEKAVDARKVLLKMFSRDIRDGMPPRIYTVVKHVSHSGMLRHIDVFYIGRDRQRISLNWYIEALGILNRGKHYNNKNADSLRIGGCGFDVGFEVVYRLSSMLYKDNFYCLGKDCRANDHVNGDRNRRRTHKHSDAGYLLRQEWM